MIRRALFILGECLACFSLFAAPYLFALIAYGLGYN